MKATFLDRSNYFKGLLLLVKYDKQISDAGKNLVMFIGKSLGFDKVFCNEAVKNLFINEYITNEYPTFSQIEITRAFLRDAIRLALVDNVIDQLEHEWLYKTALNNNISPKWLLKEINEIKSNDKLKEELEIQKIQLNLY